MNGYAGKILRVDLTRRSISVEEPPETFYRKYFGGTGFIAHYLLKEVPKGADPLGPLNKVIFALGPMTGHPLPGSGRNSVGAKSPLTGGIGFSEAGGFWGAGFKRAGFDAIIVEGKSETPCYIYKGWNCRDPRRFGHLEDNRERSRPSSKKEIGDDRLRSLSAASRAKTRCAMPVC